MKQLLLIFVLIPLFSNAQLFEGKWYSSFTVMGNSMRMNLEVSESPELTVTLINPEMNNGDNGVVCDTASIEGNQFSFTWKGRNLSYEGTLENGVISGTMKQSGVTWEAIFTREVQELIQIQRPQNPKGPFPYTSDSVQINNGTITLGATLTLPENFDDATPIVILVSGSGQQNRDCEIGGHKPFWVITDYLARKNIAVIRFDDRGTGTSTGDASASLMDYSSDVEAIARYLRKERKFKKNPLGAIGHSEGGMHTLIAASNFKKFDFLIQLATVGTDGKTVLVTQQYDIPKASGEPDDLCKWNRKLFANMSDIVLSLPQDEAEDSLTKMLGDAYDNAVPSFDKSSASKMQFTFSNNAFMNSQWMREFLAFNAAEYLEQIDIPLLAIHAGNDIQVAPQANSKGFDAYKYAETHIIDGLNHLFQPCERCSIDEYSEIETTISTDVLHLMATWVLGLN
ncbi:MAG: alpha/beta fold hydrolase [Crocinitomicaceae bacterium]